MGHLVPRCLLLGDRGSCWFICALICAMQLPHVHGFVLGFGNAARLWECARKGAELKRSMLPGKQASSSLFQRTAPIMVAAPSDKAVSVLLHVMSSNTDNAGLQAKGCATLHDLASRSEVARMSIFANGGVDVVLAAMQAHPEHADVQLSSASFLGGQVLTDLKTERVYDELHEVTKKPGSSKHKLLQETHPEFSTPQFPDLPSPSDFFVRDEYRPPNFEVDQVVLDFHLNDDSTRVLSELRIRRRDSAGSVPLTLDSTKGTILNSISIDGRRLDETETGPSSLSILCPVPDACSISTDVSLSPHDNFEGKGLFYSSGRYCTQCEPQCFRMISPMLDRPDVTATYSVRIEADKRRFPLLLSNGNLIRSADLDGGRHYVQWEDPHPKACYLFALFAGDLDSIHDSFTTKSGERVELAMHTERGKASQLEFAMDTLKKVMAWEEAEYGLEFDLERFNVVVLDDFATGAMENKGLNIYNSACVAIRETATDEEMEAVLCTVAHEYLHNWTGNRVTVRSWFDLALKEGLTVFRDQQFGEFMAGRGADRRRIEDVVKLRGAQLMEETGGQWWTVRPDRVDDVMQIYTPTVYNKGAELVRMLRFIVGEEKFREGLQLLIRENDGAATTVSGMLRAMSATSGEDLTQFERWYSHAGTPTVTIKQTRSADSNALRIHFKQHPSSSPFTSSSAGPLHIPLSLALLSSSGEVLQDKINIHLREWEEAIEVEGVPADSVLSVRGFTAPVHVEFGEDGRGDRELGVLVAEETDAFARWEAAQELFLRSVMARAVQSEEPAAASRAEALLIEGIRKTLASGLDDGVCAKVISPPELQRLGEEAWGPNGAERWGPVDALSLSSSLLDVKRAVGSKLQTELHECYMLQRLLEADEQATNQHWDSKQVGRRSLKNACLAFMACIDDDELRGFSMAQAVGSGSVTDVLAATKAVAGAGDEEERGRVLDHFYQEHAVRDEALLNKFMTMQDPNNAFFNVHL